MHGRDGWELENYDWDPDTGLATLTYERLCPDTKAHQEQVIVKPQPTEPRHVGWYTRS